MILKEYINSGGRFYQKVYTGKLFWKYILKGKNTSGESAEWAKEEVQDIKDGKALVLCPNIPLAHIINIGVYVLYPKLEEWKNVPEFKNFREMSVEEIFDIAESYDTKTRDNA